MGNSDERVRRDRGDNIVIVEESLGWCNSGVLCVIFAFITCIESLFFLVRVLASCN